MPWVGLKREISGVYEEEAARDYAASGKEAKNYCISS
jgi:hypothetical protein